MLRAVLKAGPILTEMGYDTGLTEEDAKTRQLVTSLVGWVGGGAAGGEGGAGGGLEERERGRGLRGGGEGGGAHINGVTGKGWKVQAAGQVAAGL